MMIDDLKCTSFIEGIRLALHLRNKLEIGSSDQTEMDCQEDGKNQFMNMVL
jgi:hypothetical protein